MEAFPSRWGIALRFWEVQEAGGNGIVERHHRTIKVMSAHQGCTVGEPVHRYNMTPRDHRRPESAPAAGLFQRLSCDLPVPASERIDDRPPDELRENSVFQVGESV